jgi:hypothetical protein
MSWQLTAASWLHTIITAATAFYHMVRQRCVLPLALNGGRDLMLLRSGIWIDSRTTVADPTYIVGYYNLEKHTIVSPATAATTSAANLRFPRWSWLSVSLSDASGRPIANNDDDDTVMTDFFGTLRVDPAVPTVGIAQILTLFAFQKGWLPTGHLSVMDSSGQEEVITCADLYARGR